MSSPYDFFNNIICINLKHRNDRYDEVNEVFSQLGIKDKVHFFLADKSPKGGMYGCFDSHIQVIKEAYANGLSNVLIFEDDIYPTSSYSLDKIKLGVDFMKSHDWDVFYFGYFVINEQYDNIFLANPVAPHIIHYNPNATHAYCMNRTGMKKILDNYHDAIGRIHVDEFLASKSLGLKSFCIVPMLFEQHLCSPHDNEAFKLSHVVARKMQCVAEKTQAMYVVSWLVWLVKSIWWLVFVIILLFVGIVALTNIPFR